MISRQRRPLTPDEHSQDSKDRLTELESERTAAVQRGEDPKIYDDMIANERAAQ